MAGPSRALAEDILAEQGGTLAACHREGALPLQDPLAFRYILQQAVATCFKEALLNLSKTEKKRRILPNMLVSKQQVKASVV